MAITNEEIKSQLDLLDNKITNHNTFVQQIYSSNIDIVSGTPKDVLLNNGEVVKNLKKAIQQFDVEKNTALASIDETELKRLSVEVALLGGTSYSEYRPMNIGVAGKSGFGIGDTDSPVQ